MQWLAVLKAWGTGGCKMHCCCAKSNLLVSERTLHAVAIANVERLPVWLLPTAGYVCAGDCGVVWTSEPVNVPITRLVIVRLKTRQRAMCTQPASWRIAQPTS